MATRKVTRGARVLTERRMGYWTESRGAPRALDLVARTASRARLRLEVAPTLRHLRLVVRDTPLAYFFLWPRWDGVEWIRGEEGASCIPPIRATTIRRVRQEPSSAAWWRAWTERLAEDLSSSPAAPLSVGTTRLQPTAIAPGRRCYGEWTAFDASVPRPRLPTFDDRDATTLGYGGGAEGTVLALRRFSDPEASRVRYWRKHARRRTLPPIVVWYLVPFASWVLVDGHDRLRAAALEGADPPLLALTTLHHHVWREPASQDAIDGWTRALELSRTRASVDRANEALIRHHGAPSSEVVTRSVPLRGGLEEWLRGATEAYGRARVVSLDACHPQEMV